mmetsp:Transcript_18340/g.69441  ORF Transcript_18340/g.69441 Transcript_18340/m.69441 type:complete len:310 (-) Transcript_18340:136-1065(-)|eukprot:scaffold10_cov257-Pinguiococcus_pyrenoidosus.AAC.43
MCCRLRHPIQKPEGQAPPMVGLCQQARLPRVDGALVRLQRWLCLANAQQVLAVEKMPVCDVRCAALSDFAQGTHSRLGFFVAVLCQLSRAEGLGVPKVHDEGIARASGDRVDSVGHGGHVSQHRALISGDVHGPDLEIAALVVLAVAELQRHGEESGAGLLGRLGIRVRASIRVPVEVAALGGAVAKNLQVHARLVQAGDLPMVLVGALHGLAQHGRQARISRLFAGHVRGVRAQPPRLAHALLLGAQAGLGLLLVQDMLRLAGLDELVALAACQLHGRHCIGLSGLRGVDAVSRKAKQHGSGSADHGQ